MAAGPDQTRLDERLLRAAATSHRRWFEAAAPENRLVDGGEDARELARAAGECGPRGFGVWSMTGDDDLGARLVELGFEWGWQPHWMGLAIDAEPVAPVGFEVVPAEPPFAKTLPYRLDGPLPAGAIHIGVRPREKLAGQAVILPGDDGVAGIFAMGVAPRAQRRGIGLALTQAALRAAQEHGCDAAVLNATPEGERVYARAGFRSLGWGQTWWRHPAAS